jgi:hypothetical protein
MSLFSDLKSMINDFISKRTAIARLVSLRLLEDPEHLQLAVEKACRNYNLIAELVRKRVIFDALLSRLSSNPEALCLMLSKSNVLYNISAQLAFLTSLAENARILEVMLTTDSMRDRIFERIASDPALLNQILVLSTACLDDGATPSTRITSILQDIAKEPVFLSSMQKDPELRQTLFDILQSGYASVGEDIAYHLETLGNAETFTT